MKKVMILVITTMITACMSLPNVPYEEYNYTPPETEQGRLCINQCLVQRNTCRDDVAKKYQQCQRENQIMELAHDLTGGNRNNNTSDNWGVDNRSNKYQRNCNMIANYCTTDYNACFESCGGQITVTRIH